MESRSLCEEPDSKSSLPCPSPPDSDLGEDTETEGCGRDRDREDMFPGGQEHRDQDRSYSESSSPVDVIVTTDSKDIPDDLTSTNSKDGSHVVKWTVSIVIAIPKGEEPCPVGEAMVLVEKAKKKPKRVLSGGVVEAPKAQTYYRIEYNMLPGDQDPVKVDLVMFGLAAKIYMENETKVLKPWLEGDQVWLGWSQSVKVRVTRELLIKLVSHKITFKIWDTKDRVSAKARYDRPKTFRLPQAKPGEDNDLGGIKSMVYKLRTMFEKKNPRTRSSNKRGDALSTDFKRFSELNCVTVEPKASTTEVSSSAALNTGSLVSDTEQCGARSGEQDLQSVDSKSAKPDGPVEQEKEKDSASSKPAQKKSALDQSSKAVKETSKTTIPPMKAGSVKDKLVVPRKKALVKSTQETASHIEHIRRNGVASLELSYIYLLAGDRCLTDCLETYSSGVYEGLCNITLDRPLISEKLKAELNPLVITILSASSLPSSPVPFHVLEEKCVPVYCQYQFHNTSKHRTKGQEHRTNVYFNDVNVIMTGLLSPGELLEVLRGPPLEIEVHDRDRKLEKVSTSPALFGTYPNDDKLSSVVPVSGKRTNHHPFRENSKHYDPCGLAKLNLNDLLQGQRSLKVNLPIRCSPPPQLLSSERSDWERKMASMPGTEGVDGQEQQPGHYFDANSQLKVHVEIACPLTGGGGASDRAWECPFGRIIYLFKYANVPVMSRLRAELLRINAVAFHLEDQSEETVERALSCYKMAAPERESRDLDVVTGFHLLDKQIHLFVLEGLKHKGVRRLWETVSIQLTGGEEDQVMVLYNSGLSFSKRLYTRLDVSFTPIHLHQPLETIMRQPLVYVRDMVPHTCFQAMSRLSLLVQLRKMKDVVQNNLFPSAEMVLSMTKEFGAVHPGRWQQRLLGSGAAEVDVLLHHGSENTQCHVDTHNAPYLQWKHYLSNQQMNKLTKDFIQANIAEVQQASLQLQRARPAVVLAPLDDEKHSIQTTTQSLGQRWPYNQQYHSATVDPQEVEAERKAREAQRRAAWRTHDGFLYPGFRSSIEANEHPKHPDEARRDELKKPWRENVLHGNTQRPTLPQRDIRPWLHRYNDMELYITPPPVLSPVPPVTIHLAGERLQREQLQGAQSQYYRWLRKVLPDAGHTPEPNCSHVRVPQFSCHMGGADPGKLHDILKDRPMKYSLRKPGLTLKPMPVLSVLQQPQQVSRSGRMAVVREESSSFAPGPFPDHSLSWDKNTIPRQPSHYNKYHFTEFLRQRSFQYKRSAPPLTDKERRIHVFQKHPAPYDTRQTARTSQSQPAQSIVETRTYRDVTLHIN
ncbi:uncharacterized protein cfap92 [Oncorhynchus mykiss]|uniref:DUF4550 domain-containing protein n=1 Tax=Oncorhynchus mykiss TaxID=8022 RepID=A0A8C7NX59_ONCMY|nr:uncharacterized protein cfap92 [Oncorhynchus mykiss]